MVAHKTTFQVWIKVCNQIIAGSLDTSGIPTNALGPVDIPQKRGASGARR